MTALLESGLWQAGYQQGVKDTMRKMAGKRGETPGQKSARLRRLARIVRDEELAREMAALIRAGETTESARHKMGSQPIGVGRAHRVRALAVRLGLLDPRGVAPDPAVKAARTQARKRMGRDEAQAPEFAALIRAGNSTEEAREKMGIGAVRAKRLRAICVKMKWVRPRQRKAGQAL